MEIIDTRKLFYDLKNRSTHTYPLVQSIFPTIPPAAVQYELQRQGLLENGEMSLPLDVWTIAKRQLDDLVNQWAGPPTKVAILPIQHGYVKNGVAYPHGICLFVSPHTSVKELLALITHEYHHICRQSYYADSPTLLDAVIMEGLAEHAVESLFGEHAVSSWTKRYSLEEVIDYWHRYFLEYVTVRGLHNHQHFLFGDGKQLPAHIGYCMGYRIVEAFLTKNPLLTTQQLLQVSSEEIALGAGFTLL
ncbi:DUF2268 domain-containing putative Zn-dependent protease [Solibacillus sp. FSL H8-0523]|uniref:DUF2268 domain-containing protein n=1 Tax=Solibacillus sp. FSL H8-0523 TaxID=2954511 RepID=UPI003100BFFF